MTCHSLARNGILYYPDGQTGVRAHREAEYGMDEMGEQISRKAQHILDALKSRYPVTDTQLVYNSPWELLVATMLAAQCTDVRVNQVTPRLFARWPGSRELSRAPMAEVEEVVRPTGFYRNKAKNLVSAAIMVERDFGGVLPRTMAEMIKLPGVARKTASCVLWGGYGINEGVAVDTHVKRISFRLGLTQSTDPGQVEKDLMAIFPQNEWGDVNHRMVWFGRDVCQARKPHCSECELDPVCVHAVPPTAKRGAR